VSISGAPYNYAGDNPLTYGDAVGLLWTPLAGGAGGADAACGATIEIPGVDIGTCGAAGIAAGAAAVGAAIGVVTAVAGNEGGDEGEAELKKKEPNERAAATQLHRPDRNLNGRAKGRSVAAKAHGGILRMTKVCTHTWARTHTVLTRTTKPRTDTCGRGSTIRPPRNS
jgi:hypothetical protein